MNVAGETAFRDFAYMPENRMDVLRFEADGTIVGKALHPVDERCNTIDLITDKPCQRLLRLAGRALKKLSRTANARQRVLDFVRKHRCSRSEEHTLELQSLMRTS